MSALREGRVHEGLVHAVGNVMSTRYTGEKQHVGYYTRCSVYLLRDNQMTRLPLDAPVGSFLTCLACIGLESQWVKGDG